MAWRSSGRTAKELLDNLLKAGLLPPDPRAVRAWELTDRAVFVPPALLPLAYSDTPQRIGYAATISAPHMHAAQLTHLLAVLQPGARVLDVGSGTGIFLALAAQLVCQGGGQCTGLEHMPALAEGSRANLGRAGEAVRAWLAAGQVQVHCADGRAGWPAGAPYNAIHVGAASPAIPPALLAQLALGGRMVIPVGTHDQELLVVDRLADGSVTSKTVMEVRFVPLCDRAEQEAAF
jgi:protein-L-isoaspartate(D-aspartate) O-methyltransferase